ncbi:MAG: signal recognition particle-docking protein FtsY, partial [Lentisphaeria bacterium]|nr:signal recognition particle-docking protein FtsY [Lentisphaeria bacterium]
MGLLDKFKKGLNVTRTRLSRSIQSAFRNNKEWTEDDYEELEQALIECDLGVQYTMQLMDDIRNRYQQGLIKTADDIIKVVQDDVHQMMATDAKPMKWRSDGPCIILMVGVNGCGKTTTTGKLGYKLKQEGKTVMFAACDTFRAAATEQLQLWGERVGCDVIAGKHGSDPSAVAFDACKAAVSRNVDVLLIDTAGRQHTKVGLMNELEKLHKSINKACPGAPH